MKPRQTLSSHKWKTLILFLGVVLLLGLGAVSVMAQGGDNDELPALKKPGGKLSYRLELLSEAGGVRALNADEQARALSMSVSGPDSFLKNAQGDLLVYIRVADTSKAALQALTSAGAEIVHVADQYSTVTAYVNPTELTGMADLKTVQSVEEALTPYTSKDIGPWKNTNVEPSPRPQGQAGCPGAVTSEGDGHLNADDARSQFSVDGSGVIVGVLSDSFAKVTSPKSQANDVASGDLPGATNPCGHLTPVNNIAPYSGAGGTDEGRGMAQIVHDLAPGANLAFATAFEGSLSFADNIRALRNTAGAQVIVDDVGYSSSPFFQDGPISNAVKDVTDDGALYFAAAGNSNKTDSSGNVISSYEANAYRPTACPTLYYNGNPVTIGSDCHDFDPGAGADNTMGMTFGAGGRMNLSFQWAEPWYGVQTDFNIVVVDGAGNILAASANDNISSQKPYEYLSYSSSGGTAYIVIVRYAGSGAPPLKYIMPRTSNYQAMEYTAANSSDIFGPTIYGQPGAKETLSIAAVPYYSTTTPESFTSRGYRTYYYQRVNGTTPAAPFSSPEVRQKPDVAATDGGCTTFFGRYSGGCYRFYGTSAAAPHTAAVAALMWEWATQNSQTINQASAEQTLESTAANLSNGAPHISGAGLVDAAAALSDIVSQAPKLSVDITPSPFPIQSDTKLITYTIKLVNSGSISATQVIISDTIPTQTTYIPGSASHSGAESGGVITWPATTLPGQQSHASRSVMASNMLTRTFQVSGTSVITNGDQLTNWISVSTAENVNITNKAHAEIVDPKFIYLPVILK